MSSLAVKKKVRHGVTTGLPIDPKGFFERVQEAFAGLKAPQIGIKLGLKKQSVYRWRDGKPPGLDSLVKIYELTGVSLHWLLTGEGAKRISKLQVVGKDPDSVSVFFGEAEHKIIEDAAAQEGRDKEDQVRELVIEALKARGLIRTEPEPTELIFFGERIPKLIPMKLLGLIAAGKPIEVFDYEETVLVAEDFLMPGHNTFVLRVQGDSMVEDNIQNGDLIICYESPIAHNGQTAVVLIDGEKVTVKKFYREGSRVRLQPANQKMSPIILSADRVRIQGIVIGIQRRP